MFRIFPTVIFSSSEECLQTNIGRKAFWALITFNMVNDWTGNVQWKLIFTLFLIGKHIVIFLLGGMKKNAMILSFFFVLKCDVLGPK